MNKKKLFLECMKTILSFSTYSPLYLQQPEASGAWAFFNSLNEAKDVAFSSF